MVLNVLSISKMQSNIAGELVRFRDPRTVTRRTHMGGSGDVDELIKTNFREHRPGMVQTEDQYKFIYRAIEHHVNKIKS